MGKLTRRWQLAALLAVGAIGLPGLWAQDTTVKGKVRLGQHRLKLEKGRLYRIKVESDGFRPQVSIRPGYFAFGGSRGGDRDTFSDYFAPTDTRSYTLTVGPDLFDDLGE